MIEWERDREILAVQYMMVATPSRVMEKEVGYIFMR